MASEPGIGQLGGSIGTLHTDVPHDVTHIACFGHEDCADAQGQIPDATSAFANVSELVG